MKFSENIFLINRYYIDQNFIYLNSFDLTLSLEKYQK